LLGLSASREGVQLLVQLPLELTTLGGIHSAGDGAGAGIYGFIPEL